MSLLVARTDIPWTLELESAGSSMPINGTHEDRAEPRRQAPILTKRGKDCKRNEAGNCFQRYTCPGMTGGNDERR